MTDTTALTVTPELAHRVLDALEQSPHIGPDGSLSALFIVRDAVKAWEAEAAREVEVLQLAKRLVQEEFGGYNQWHDLSTSGQERRIQYVKFILAFLAADGRLLPEGGTIIDGLIRAIPGETSAGTQCTGAGDCGASPHIHGCFADTGDCDDPGDHPDSGPDGTPEKPWPTWQDVPEGVAYRGARDRSGWEGWINQDGARCRVFDGAPSKNADSTLADEAPFVRVDGGQQ